MTFDNGKTIIKLRLRLFIATIIMLIYVFLVYFGKHLKFPIIGISETTATLTLVAIYLVLALSPLLLKYKYIYFSDDGRNIIFRYYSVGLYSGKKNSVEIPKDEFTGYKINRQLAGLIKSIRLYRLVKNRKASYMPVYLSSLKKPEVNRISNALNKYIKQE